MPSKTPTAPSRTSARAARKRATSAEERRTQRKNATRRDLLASARRLFSREGIYQTRIEDISNQAGLAKGTAYLYFESREELLAAVVEETFEELEQHVREATAATAPANLAEGVFRAHVEFYARHPDLMRILHQVRGMLKFSRARGSRLRALLRAHIEFLAALLARGPVPSASPARRRELATFLFGSVSGTASVLAAAYPERNGLSALADLWAEPVAEAVRRHAQRVRGRA